jgi:hypothetical protein
MNPPLPSLWKSYWKVLTLQEEAFAAIKTLENGFVFSLKLFLLLAVITTIGKLTEVRQIRQQVTLAGRVQMLATNIAGITEENFSLFDRLIDRSLLKAADWLDQLAAELEGLQAPLDPQPSKILRLIGEWLSLPLLLLSAWIGVSLGVWIIARLMHTEGSLHQHMSLLLLSFAPQILTAINYFPTGLSRGLTNLISGIALIWSIAIAIQALSTVNNISKGKSVLILGLYFLVAVVAIPAMIALLASVLLIVIL